MYIHWWHIYIAWYGEWAKFGWHPTITAEMCMYAIRWQKLVWCQHHIGAIFAANGVMGKDVCWGCGDGGGYLVQWVCHIWAKVIPIQNMADYKPWLPNSTHIWMCKGWLGHSLECLQQSFAVWILSNETFWLVYSQWSGSHPKMWIMAQLLILWVHVLRCLGCAVLQANMPGVYCIFSQAP